MAISLLSETERVRMRAAGRAAASTLALVGARVAPGVRTSDIDRWVREHTRYLGGRPSQLGYRGFPAAVCTSINDVVCHGIPSREVRLRSGDIVNVDVTTELDGFHGDTSATFLVGEVDGRVERLVAATERAMWAGIEVVRPGARIGDIGAAIVDVARREGFAVVPDYCGHGIGRSMHQPPQVPHVGERGRGLRLRPGMSLTVEPMLSLGIARTQVDADGWTVRTLDGSPSAQFEHTVLVTEGGVEVLTERPPRESTPRDPW